MARPGASDEDDGVLIAAVHDGTATTAAASSYLLVLNATTMKELAKVSLPPAALPLVAKPGVLRQRTKARLGSGADMNDGVLDGNAARSSQYGAPPTAAQARREAIRATHLLWSYLVGGVGGAPY